MIINHQEVNKIAKTLLFTTIDWEIKHLLYPYVTAMNDAVVSDILQIIEIYSITNNQNLNYVFIPEHLITNVSDNVIILEWWESDPETPYEMSGIRTSEDMQDDQQIEYRVSFYQGSEGLSRIIDRKTLPPGEKFLDVKDRNRIINNLVEFLHE